ncbi:carbohydrate ABC transporter permease [Microbacterium sp. CPCC 204701]|uniref:carbohydrate ABC transporter permease n=1 Tax=Microbacterium sp. CPCC 204701 TaxID=2493084 RepID=UPI000FD7AA9B|nr:carbohydrate ABC transporter permease [Microbacterium sp. CPCC 204701]
MTITSEPSEIIEGEVALTAPAAAERRPRRSLSELRPRRVAYHVFVIAVLALILFPGIWLLLSSFKPSAQIVGNTELLPQTWTIENYVKALDPIGGVQSFVFFLNSLILSIGTVIGVCVSASLTAYAFARVRFVGRNVLFAVMIGTMLLPFHVLLVPQYVIFQSLGLVDTFWPLLLPKFLAADAFFIFLMVQFIRGLPRELDEAAKIDGAGHLRTFVSIILPLLRPALITSAIFAFIWSWNDFMGPLIYLNSPDLYPLPLALNLLNAQSAGGGAADYGAMMAMSVLSLVPVMLFFAFFQRYLVEGVATQGLKG